MGRRLDNYGRRRHVDINLYEYDPPLRMTLNITRDIHLGEHFDYYTVDMHIDEYVEAIRERRRNKPPFYKKNFQLNCEENDVPPERGIDVHSVKIEVMSMKRLHEWMEYTSEHFVPRSLETKSAYTTILVKDKKMVMTDSNDEYGIRALFERHENPHMMAISYETFKFMQANQRGEVYIPTRSQLF